MAASPTTCRSGSNWIDSEIFEREDAVQHLEDVHGILVPGGFGERGAEGKIQAARFARERQVPYFGICFGMQMAVIEAARNLAGIRRRGSTEFGPAKDPVVGLMTEWVRGNTVERRNETAAISAAPCASAPMTRIWPGQPGRRDLRQRRDQRAPPPSLRGQHQLQGPAGGGGPALLRHVARRHPAGDRRASRTIPGSSACSSIPELKSKPFEPASAVHLLHRRGRRSSRGWSEARRA